MDKDYWNPKKKSQGVTKQYMRAIAAEIKKRMTVVSDASSFKALTAVGLSPKGAARYYLGTIQRESAIGGEDGTNITSPLIDAYFADMEIDDAAENLMLSGEQVEDGYAEIAEFCDGALNIDSVHSGVKSDDNSQALNIISVVIDSCGISPDDVYKKACNLTTSDNSLRFEGNGRKLFLPLAVADGKAKGFIQDKEAYERRLASLNDGATLWVFVTCAARELGSESAHRHIAFSAYVLDFIKQGDEAWAVRDEVKALLTDGILTAVLPKNQAAARDEVTPARVAKEFFRIAVDGKYAAPMGRGLTAAPPELCLKIRRLLGGDKDTPGEEKAEATFAFSDYMVNCAGMFQAYCVNANILPTRVTPKAGYTIPERPLFAVWYGRDWLDYKSIPSVRPTVGACLYYKLIDNKTKPWKKMSSICSRYALINYWDKDKETRRGYPKDLEYICAAHPADIEYARGIEPPVPKMLPVPRKDCPIPALYPEVMLMPAQDSQDTAVLPTQGFRLFSAFDAADYFYNRSKLPVLPAASDKRERVRVHSLCRTMFRTADGTWHNCTEVANLDFDKFAGLCIRGGKYILLDAKNRLWEVTI